MNPNITNIIDRYLTGELSQEDHAAFEEKMEESASLRSEVQLQQAIMEGITRNHQRSDIQKIAKRYHAFKAVKWIGLSVIAIAAIAVSSYLVLSANSHSGEEQEQSFPRQTLIEMPDRVRTLQPLFSKTGGLHAAAIFGSDGEIRVVREDVGRHNATDKAIGALLASGELPGHQFGLLVSGRASFELMQK